MALPVLNVPTFDIRVPSTNKMIKCRPFLVKEEKILLMAMESQDEKEIVNAVKQILTNCIVDPKGHTVEKLALFDLEFIFLKMRTKSKGEVTRLRYKGVEDSECEECKKPKEVVVNLNNIAIKKDENHTNKIQLNDDVGVVMKYPQFSLLMKIDKLKTSGEIEIIFSLIRDCMESIYDKENVYNVSDITEEEMNKFIDSLTSDQFEKIGNFFNTMPHLEYEVDLSCKKCGRVDKQIIQGIQSFFQ